MASNFLRSIRVGDRLVEYAVSGCVEGEPVLLFYPLGACRCMALLLDTTARRSGARLICVNRPGMGNTSPAAACHVSTHLHTACQDAVACLDNLQVDRASILFLCAGSPFGLAFCSQFPERTTGRVAGCSAWVSPADCPNARTIYKLAASLMPESLLSHAVALGAQCFQSMPLSVFPEIDIGSSEGVMQYYEDEFGGEGEDVAVLLSPSESWGLSYRKLPFPVSLFHGEMDETVPLACGEWLCDQLPRGTRLYSMEGASHSDVLLFGVDSALRRLVRRVVDKAAESDA
eukprot:TRINITY_DN26336_c0_g1_i1.p1 TRINITY_DN26336_c0_g1~~TRINITY_DN26336_c0_g1_i1.p1  ORF type:complete len:288 (-),score=25.87 TRINITY_DN26336_c0_g1_i1:71-934(-)